MAFDKKTRNLLQRTVTACRRLLDGEFTAQLQELYGIQPEGALAPAAALNHLGDEELAVARLLRERINHLEGGTATQALTRTAAQPEHIARVIREQAFTVLNRLAALRLCEERGLVLECVRQGVNSEGFQLFTSSAGNALGETHEAYRVYLHCLFDELALDLGVLFDRFSPLALLFPRHAALTEVLSELNGTGKAAEREEMAPEQFAEIWQADETIGWIYQYYNDETERKKMRDESSAPRNSRELAVRNQFFTPRYVVEFLTDNTLGRTWYEMTRGQTRLKDQCRYLVRRPNEIFLNPGEPAPSEISDSQPSTINHQPNAATPTQEELLRQPVPIPHRPLKDPRTILMLDPACGSMHFGLYAFDLFEVIYDEAWALEETLGADAPSRPLGTQSLHDTYAGNDAFRKDVPRLIIEHNLHGIDIDPRCAQIAGLSLWLRAQKAWQRLGLQPAERPAIKRSNIVCAEPMPGEEELLRDFVEREFPAERDVFLPLLVEVFGQMKRAGEAGALLKIEVEIRSAIEEARQRWEGARQRPEFFDTAELARLGKRAGTQQELPTAPPLPAAHLSDEQFWATAEKRIYDALRDYAEQAENGGGFQRRLFADDAKQGFGFIDICRKRYDVALMNPPFGDASLPSKPYLDDAYGDTRGDVYKAFVECFHARLVPAGYLGIISSRTGFFLGQSEDWRTRVVLRLFRPIALADLGSGVLDAMVEVAAYVLRSLSAPEARDLTLSIVPALEKVVRDSQDRFSLPKWQAARGGLKRHQAVAELEHLEAHGFVQRSPGDIVRYSPLWHVVNKVTTPPVPTYPPLVCVRALGKDDKGALLAEAIRGSDSRHAFVCDPGTFEAIPSKTFAYWAPTRVNRLFRNLPQVEGGGRMGRLGVNTTDDFRFLRLYWEIATLTGERRWMSIFKGGGFRPFFNPSPLMMDWEDGGKKLKALIEGRGDSPSRNIRSEALQGRCGLTYSSRTQKGLGFQPLPAESLFTVKGPAVFANDTQELLALLALMNSVPFRFLVSLQMAFGSFEIGVIQRTPLPILSSADVDQLGVLAVTTWQTKRLLDMPEATSHAFLLPALLAASGSTLAERAAAWAVRVHTSEETVAAIQTEIDDLAFRLYGLDAADRAALTSTLATDDDAEAEAETGEEEEAEAATADATALAADLLSYGLGVAFGRWDIRYATGEQAAPELPDPFAPLPVCPPGQLQNAQGLPARPEDVPAAYPLKNIPWDGILVDDPNHPLDLERRVREVIKILWSPPIPTGLYPPAQGCEVGQSGSDRATLGGPSHARPTPTGLCQSTPPRQPDRLPNGQSSPSAPSAPSAVASPESIEHEACQILGVKSLRDYFRRRTGFFADHLQRYSKSRRQAPIYWPLSTASGSYTLWIYYHRLTPDTLYKCLQQFVNPKLADVEKELAHLRAVLAANEGGAKERKRLEELEDFRRELIELRTELELWAPKWKPNLNDGVLITAAPLWKLFRLPKWQKDLKTCWQELEKGDYDWAHLAYTLWPDRVREKCKTDRSLAIAHGLEALCAVKAPVKKVKKAKKQKEQMDWEAADP